MIQREHTHTHTAEKSCAKTILLSGMHADTFYSISSSLLKSARHEALH